MAKRSKQPASRSTVKKEGIVRLGDLLPQLIARYGIQQRRDVEHLVRAWQEAVGDPYASITRVVGLKRGTLEIAVPHNAFVQELSFRQKELLASMQASVLDEKITRIKFVVSADKPSVK